MRIFAPGVAVATAQGAVMRQAEREQERVAHGAGFLPASRCRPLSAARTDAGIVHSADAAVTSEVKEAGGATIPIVCCWQLIIAALPVSSAAAGNRYLGLSVMGVIFMGSKMIIVQ